MQLLAVLLAVHYLLLPLIAGARKSITVVTNLNPSFVLAGIAAEAASLAAYAELARAPIPSTRLSLWAVLRVQLATLGPQPRF